MTNHNYPAVSLLSKEAMDEIHQTSLRILSEIGMRIHSLPVLELLAEQQGISVDMKRQLATFSPMAIQNAIKIAPSVFNLYGRDDDKPVSLSSAGGLVTQSVSGEYALVDPLNKTRRSPTLKDMVESITVADALLNIDIIGAHVLPTDVPIEVRDIHIFAELLKRTRKPVRTWIHNPTTASYILELLMVVAGDSEKLRVRPRGMFGVEPISPLVMMKESVETLVAWLELGQPVVIAPMVQSIGTGPTTIAGTIAQQNAEILACLAIVQTLAPGTGAVFACSNLTLDPRTANTVFACPEQLLANMIGRQLGQRYGLPVGVQMSISDAIVPDTQAGLEKGTSLLLGAMSGASLNGGLGIAGGGQGASLPQLIIDDEIIGFVRTVLNGVEVNEETLGFESIKRVGTGGNFLTDTHTLKHVRERWIPNISNRHVWETWKKEGSLTMLDQAVAEKDRILREHEMDWMDEAMQQELDRIVSAAEREVIGE